VSLTFEVVVEDPVINVEVTEYEVGTILVAGPQGRQGDPGRGVVPFSEILAECDGATTTFLLSQVAISLSSVQVFRNGLAEVAGIGFALAYTGLGTTVTFSTAPLSSDVVAVTYHI